MMFAGQNGVEWVDDISFDREPYGRSRSLSVRATIGLDIDGVLWCDSDMVVERHTFYSLIMEQRPLHAALAFDRRPPYTPVAFYEEPFRPIEDFSQGIVEVDGVGFGTVYTSLEVLKAVGSFTHPPDIDEDRYFCMKAKKLGFPVTVDTHTRVLHIAKPRLVGIKDHLIEASLSDSSLPPEKNP